MVIASLTWVVTDRAPVSVHPPDLDKFNCEGFKVINFKRGGDGKPGVFHNTGCQGPVLVSLSGVRIVLEPGFPVEFCKLHHAVAGDILDEGAVHPECKFPDKLLLPGLVLGITDHSGKAAGALCPR